MTSHLREGARRRRCARADLPRPALAAPAAGPARQRRGALDADARRSADPRRRHRAAVGTEPGRARRRSTRRRCRAASRSSPGNRPATSRSSCAAGWQRTPEAVPDERSNLTATCSRSPAPRPGTVLAASQGRDPRARARPRAAPPRSSSTCAPRRSTSSCSRSPRSTTCRARREAARARGVLGDRPGRRTSSSQGGIGYAKDVLERALGGEKAVEIMGRLSSYIRRLAVRVPAQGRAAADLQLPAERAPADDGARARATCRRDVGATVMSMFPQDLQAEVAHARRGHGPHGARGDPRGRAGHGAQARLRHQPGARRGRRRQVARRHPELRRPRAPSATSSSRSTSATRSSPRTCAS